MPAHHNGTVERRFQIYDQLFVRERVIFSSFLNEVNPARATCVCFPGRPLEKAVDWQAASLRPDAGSVVQEGLQEDDAPYAMGWTVGGLATLATVVVVRMFAI